jgi:CheY-like chemotaxis protein
VADFQGLIMSLRSLFGRAAAPAPPSPDTAGILVVDDEIAIRGYAEVVLKKAGYRPLLASCGDEALRIAAAMPRLDILVTDLLMPEMNGDELARRIRQRAPVVKVLYQTGYSDRLFAEKSLLWDQEAFIDKPYSIGALEEAVAMLLYGHLHQPQPPPGRVDGNAVWTGGTPR